MMYVAGYESEVEEDATEGPGEETFQEQKVERRKAEPYDVPTSGAFWMHDDRMDDEEFAASGYAPLSALSSSKTTSFDMPYMPVPSVMTFLVRPLYFYNGRGTTLDATALLFTCVRMTKVKCCRYQALNCCRSCLDVIPGAQARSASAEEEAL